MKKINYLILPIFLFIFINNCVGYKPIFATTDLQFKIGEYSIEGDKKLGNKIYTKLYNLSKSQKNNPNAKSISLVINSSKSKEGTSKNTSGKILEYKIILITEVEVEDFLTGSKILSQTFTSSLTYKVQDQYSETVKLENKSVENLIEKTYQELLIRISENITS